MMRIAKAAALALAVAVVAPVANAAKPAAPAAAAAELSVDQIVEKAMSKGAVGFKQGAASIQMTLYTAKGEAKARSLDIKAMRGKDGMLRSMVRFSKPADVNGTSFLVVEKNGALPDQYVYVPASKVVRRIAAGNASSSFFGSNFAFIDLMPLPMSEKDKVATEKLPDAEVGGQPVHVIAITPKIEGAPYSKLVIYVHKEFLVPMQIDFSGPDKKPLKTLRVKKLQKVKGEMVPVEVEMKAENGTRTELLLEKVDPDAVLSEADFTEEAMQR